MLTEVFVQRFNEAFAGFPPYDIFVMGFALIAGVVIGVSAFFFITELLKGLFSLISRSRAKKQDAADR